MPGKPLIPGRPGFPGSPRSPGKPSTPILKKQNNIEHNISHFLHFFYTCSGATNWRWPTKRKTHQGGSKKKMRPSGHGSATGATSGAVTHSEQSSLLLLTDIFLLLSDSPQTNNKHQTPWRVQTEKGTLNSYYPSVTMLEEQCCCPAREVWKLVHIFTRPL